MRERLLIEKIGKKRNLKTAGGIALLACAVFLAAGCGKETTNNENMQERTKEMGRYVEESGEEQELFGRIGSFTELKDGSLAILDMNEGIFVSDDNGKSWSEKECQPLDELFGNAFISAGAISPDGEIVWRYSLLSETEDEEAAEDIFQNTMKYGYVSWDGSTKELTLPSMDGSENNDYIDNFWFSPEGVLYAGSGNGKLLEIDIENSHASEIMETDGIIGCLAFTEQYFVALTDNGTTIYDREKKEVQNEDKALNEFAAGVLGEDQVKYASANYTLFAAGSGADIVYFICTDGIYRHVIGGGTVEKLMEGSLYSYGDPYSSIFGMLPKENGELLIQVGKTTSRMYYDESMPSVPERTLTVFGMERDDALQRAVSLFQRKNQNVYVQYEIGMTGSDGKTKEDVITGLNTEILAGNGPDVISLNGLPMDSYQEKGMLYDMAELVGRLSEGGEYFENILNVYEQDGKISMVPVRFTMPLIAGPQEDIEGIDSLKSLAEAAERMRERKPQGSILNLYDPGDTIKRLALVCGPSWTKKNGELEEDNISEFLQMAAKIYQLEQIGLQQGDLDFYNSNKEMYRNCGLDPDSLFSDISQSSPNIFSDPDSVQMGILKGNDMDVLSSVKRQTEGTDYQLWQGQGGKIFYPDLIVGISSGSVEKELAEAFMEELLSTDNLENVYGGFTVNREAVTKQFAFTQSIDGSNYGLMGVLQKDGSTKLLDIYDVQPEENEYILELISTLDTGYLTDNIVESAVVEAGSKVLAGDMDIEQALEEIRRTTKLKLAE